MKNIFPLIGFLLIPFFAVSQSERSNDSILVWVDSYKLNWSDFRGSSVDKRVGAAYTSYKIEILPTDVLVDEDDNIQGYENLTAEAQFYRNRSWSNLASGSILSHEQLHFDIAELFARKLRKRFRDFQEADQAQFSVYWQAYELFWKECRRLQQEYDFDTNHGRNSSANQIWIARINKELEDLAEFK